MNNFKKVLAFLCSATLIVGSSVTAFATDPSSTTTPASGTTPATTTGGAGNIVAYSVETVTVPTAVKVSFNPQGWKFNIRGTGSTAITSTEQIVSLNYGIATAATLDKKIKVSFTAVPGTNSSGTEDVDFVDTAAKAEAKDDDNKDGAAPGEYKMYLAVAPSTAAVAKGYAADGTATDFKVDSTSKATTVTTALLGDVDMTAAEVGVQVFSDNKAEMNYYLDKAVYVLKSDASIDFTTTQSEMASKFDTQAIGSVVGFTFVGAMNPNADWTKAKINALAITPTYEVEDVDGTETTLTDDGAYNVIGEAAAAATDDFVMVKANGAFSYTFVSAPTGSITAFTVDGASKIAAVNAGNITYNNGVLTINSTATTNMGLATGNHTIKATIGGTAYTLTIAN